MTQKENYDEVNENLEKIVMYTKDISSYLDNMNDALSELLDMVSDYDHPKDKVYTYELGEDEEC
jgi:Zn-dependent M32 family carboxypeptidase